MTRKIVYQSLCSATLLALAFPSLAGTLDLQDIQINGFASVYGVATDNNNAAYKEAGRDVSFDTDTMAGIQFMMPVHERVKFTLQMISKAENDYQLDAEWAYATFKVNDMVDVRAGRLRVPFFTLSESQEVGYSYAWVRPPVDVYGQSSFTEFSGVDSMIHVPVGDGEFVFHPFYGTMSPDAEMGGQPAGADVTVYGLNMQYAYDWWSVHLAYTTGELSLYSDAISSITASLPPAGTHTLESLMLAASGGDRDVADQFALTDMDTEFIGIGFDIDKNDVKLMGEYTRRTTSGFVTDVDSWYLMAGYRIGKWMPHLTFSGFETKSDFDDALAAIPGINTGLGPVVDGMVGVAVQDIIQANTVNQDSVTVGVRYDILPRVALKAEWQHIEPEKGSSLMSVFSGSEVSGPGKLDDVNLFSAGVDLVF